MIVGSALGVLIGIYREFFRGHMAELSRALACLALLCIDQLSLRMSHSFQYIIVNALSKSGVSLSYTRSNISVSSSVLYLKNSFRSSISVSRLLILCVYAPFLLLPSCLKIFRGHSAKIVGDKNREGISPFTLSGPGEGGRGPDDQTHSCQSETSYSMMPKFCDL